MSKLTEYNKKLKNFSLTNNKSGLKNVTKKSHKPSITSETNMLLNLPTSRKESRPLKKTTPKTIISKS